jgi:thymidylate synthase (FAD)
MQVRLITRTTGVEGTEYEGKSIDEIVIGIARLSSSREVNELFTDASKLIRHCILNQHWSIFEMANLTFEVITSRAMGREMLRHKSMSPQEFSQRYAIATEFEPIEVRAQSTNNRQSSSEAIDPIIAGRAQYASDVVEGQLDETNKVYKDLLSVGVARECARMVLPETTTTKMYFNGNIRSWISFLNQRLHGTAQKEIREVAEAVRDAFIKECPMIAKALFDFEDAHLIHIMERIVLEKYGFYDTAKYNVLSKNASKN